MVNDKEAILFSSFILNPNPNPTAFLITESQTMSISD